MVYVLQGAQRTMTEANIIAEIDSSNVLRVTINREADRNALSLSMLDSLYGTFRKRVGNQSIRFARLRGAGDKAFAAGGDLKVFVGGTIPASDRDALDSNGVSAVFTAAMRIDNVGDEFSRIPDQRA